MMHYPMPSEVWTKPNRIAELEASLEQVRQARDDWRGRWVVRGRQLTEMTAERDHYRNKYALQVKETDERVDVLARLRKANEELQAKAGIWERVCKKALRELVDYVNSDRDFQRSAEYWQSQANYWRGRAVHAEQAAKRVPELVEWQSKANIALKIARNKLIGAHVSTVVNMIESLIFTEQPVSPSGENATAEPHTTGPCNHSGNGGCGCGPDRDGE